MHESLAFALALVLVLVLGPQVIRLLAARCRESIRQDSARLAALSSPKAGTPTMGGLLILAGFLITVCLLADLSQPIVSAAIVLTLGLGAIGVCDDLSKRNSRRRGISARVKLAAQAVIALPVACWLCQDGLSATLAVLVIVGMSNAVNLTDGLDGLAGGCSLLVLAALGLTAGLGAHGSDITVLIASLAGAVLGFLWFNRHPARVFMGDTGSLPLGGLLGLLIVASGYPLPALIACGVFLVEAASVVLQVWSFQSTGRRIFLCAPLHHHFQFLGWSERQIVGRFWLAGLLCAVLGLATRLFQHPLP